MKIQDLLKLYASQLTPANGDQAYTVYRGKHYFGILQERDTRFILSPHGLYVGYDAPIHFDAEAGMFFAPADVD